MALYIYIWFWHCYFYMNHTDFLLKLAIKLDVTCCSNKFGSFGKYRNRTERTDTELARYRIFLRNRSVPVFSGTEFVWVQRNRTDRFGIAKCPGWPGTPLASRMVHLVLASLLNQFKWRIPNEVQRNGIDMVENFGVTLKKATALCAIATPVWMSSPDQPGQH